MEVLEPPLRPKSRGIKLVPLPKRQKSHPPLSAFRTPSFAIHCKNQIQQLRITAVITGCGVAYCHYTHSPRAGSFQKKTSAVLSRVASTSRHHQHYSIVSYRLLAALEAWRPMPLHVSRTFTRRIHARTRWGIVGGGRTDCGR